MARAADVLLADGTAVHIRPITPEDAEAVVALHSRFSERTRYLRYFSPYPRIPARDLKRFVNVDHHDREAFVVALGDQLIAIGRYERLGPEAPDAEVAFVVEDAHQRRGIGSVLLEHLAAAAAEAGIHRFVAEVLPENRRMLGVFADAGYQTNREYADGVVHLTFPIAPTPRSVEVSRDRERRTESASIARLLTPRSVAVYGVRRDGTGLGAAVHRRLLGADFAGTVQVVHSGESLTGPVDLAVVAVPAASIPAVLADAGAAGVHGLVVITDAEPSLFAAARGLGMRVVGPNCLGVINTDPAVRLNASLAPELADRGRVGFFCQSAPMGVALLAESHERGIGLSTFVSAGSRADVSGNDLLQYWRDDPATDVVLLYLETFGNPRKFSRIARELGREKPIVAVVTGQLAGVPDAGLIEQSGVIRVETVAELFDAGLLLSRRPLPAGPRLGVVTNSTALTALATGAAGRVSLVPNAPITLPATAPPAALAEATRRALADPELDSVLIVVSPPLPEAGTDPDAQVAAIAEAAAGADKPVLAAVTGRASGVVDDLPCYSTVEEAVRALGYAVRYAAWRRRPAGRYPEPSGVDDGDLVSAYGLTAVPQRTVENAEGAVVAADELGGGPMALKTATPALRHRLDLGAVRLDVIGPEAIRRVYAELARDFGPEVVVQPMAPAGVACVVEAVDDPAFGPIVGFGLGGVATELLGDKAWRPAPLSDVDAEALIREPRAAPLLFGYGGSPPVDLPALVDLLMRVGQLADERPDVKRVLLNPVLAHPKGLTVLHVSIETGPATTRPDTGPRRLR